MLTMLILTASFLASKLLCCSIRFGVDVADEGGARGGLRIIIPTPPFAFICKKVKITEWKKSLSD